MNRFLRVGLLLLFCLINSYYCHAEGMERVEPIELKKPGDIQDAMALNNAVDILSNKVMECVNQKVALADDCHCLYPKESLELRKVYEETLSRHPDWRDHYISWYNTQSHQSHTLSLKGLLRSLEKSCEKE